MTVSNQIVKTVTLAAPVPRVWRALTDPEEFGTWFGVRLDGPFVPGQAVTGQFVADLDEARMVAYQESLGLEPSGVRMPGPDAVFCTVERMEPQERFSFRWIPYGMDADADLANEPTTLVEFRLQPSDGGTLLTITESGFDRVPAHRRERAYRMNDGGWAGQAENVRKHVER